MWRRISGARACRNGHDGFCCDVDAFGGLLEAEFGMVFSSGSDSSVLACMLAL